MLRYLVHFARLVGVDAEHLMDVEASRRGLDHQIRGGEAEVVDRGSILFLVAFPAAVFYVCIARRAY